MARKRPIFGVSNYKKRTQRKRPGRHAKNIQSVAPDVNVHEDKEANGNTV